MQEMKHWRRSYWTQSLSCSQPLDAQNVGLSSSSMCQFSLGLVVKGEGEGGGGGGQEEGIDIVVLG